MPSFRRPYEWQQSADRHTRLIDPVLTVRQLSRFELSIKHVVRIDHALVFSTPKGGYETYPPPTRPSRSEIAARRYTAVYEVDMGVHPFTDAFVLPSDNDALEFTAEVDVSWQVTDPGRFVASGVRDVPTLLIGELQQAARPVTRGFAIADSGAAERELLRAVMLLGPLGATVGLQATWTLRLRRDQANIDHQQRLQAIDHFATEQIRTAQQGMQVDVEMDQRHRQQDELQLERAMIYGRQQQELALQQQRWQHEQMVLEGRQALELQQLEAEKIAFYQWHLSQGGVQSWALHLAQHPEDSHLVMNSMREDQLRMIQAQMELVKELLAGEGAEKFELEGPKQLALRTVSDILTQRLPGVPQNPPLLPSAEGSADIPPAPGKDPGPDPVGPSVVGPGAPYPPCTPPGPTAPYPPGTPQTPPSTSYAPPGAATPSPPPHAAPGAAVPYPTPTAPAGPPANPVPPSYTPTVPAAPYVPQPAPAAPAWQPPPGYGTTPTAPDQVPPPAPPGEQPGSAPQGRAAEEDAP
ncbi:hypothetical protein ROS62_04565 [Streptomyces sp. DSM 41972]|uniref:PE-PGRS family protein n=1 Tax=Streptomyces althioticus subsp. attaecolombicae TaxID=3075534 RepID=A0ABU3HU83_9ACTN|nr:hypothetical protein [Streptomyces sp. DSM 41972]SCD40129.1 hypothetical protein GA0115245_10482 [Streptomyces sp. di188]SCD48489.1 hypothetical protein GA0115238_11132 [Streptomyces sp. di50b]